jgi:hypothetical protein
MHRPEKNARGGVALNYVDDSRHRFEDIASGNATAGNRSDYRVGIPGWYEMRVTLPSRARAVV